MSRAASFNRIVLVSAVFYLGAMLGANAACVTGVALAKSGDDVAALVAGGDAFLARYATGGSLMVRDVRDYAMSDGSTAAFLTKLAANANDRQRASLAAGLGQAAMSCAITDPTLAAAIQDAVAKANDPVFQSLFLAVTGTVQPTAFTSAGPATSSGLVGAFNGVPDSTGGNRATAPSTPTVSSGGGDGGSTARQRRTTTVTFAITPATTTTTATTTTGRDPTSP